jgi:tetratricopeptide (TPR) repeat protein
MEGMTDVEALLSQGVAAAKAGKEDEARDLLSQVLDLDPENERAWLWMSGLVPNEEKIVCLQNVLEINPSNEFALIGLESLLGKSGRAEEQESAVGKPGPPVAGLREETESSTSSAAEKGIPRRGRGCAAQIGLAFLAVIAFAVCGVAAVLGGMVITAQPQQATPTTTAPVMPADTPTPVPELTFPPTFTPTPTLTPVPTPTLVVPDAYIPGFPIISEGAYDEVETRVSDLRELEGLREVQMVTFTRYRLEDYLNEWYQREEYLAELETTEKLYRVLGLIEEDYDLVENQIEVLREYIAGLYDSEREEIYLVLDRYTSDLWLEVTFAHEFTHALQDQHFDLDSLDDRSLTTDSRLALQALIEGDATLVMVEYAYEYLFQMSFDRSDLLEAIQQVEQGEYEGAPTVVRETEGFPYEQGIVFAAALLERGGWEQLNQAFRDPPQTTEQVMHPDKYLAGEVGQVPEVGSLPGALGEGWEELSRDVLGELFIRVYLERELGSEEALMAAEGWEGDTAAFLSNEEEGQQLFVLRIHWDSESNADEFFSAYATFMQRAGAGTGSTEDPHRQWWHTEGQVACLSQQGDDTLLLLASDSESLETVLAEFAGF